MKITVVTKPRRELCFDLENRPLAYWYDGNATSQITAFSWKWSDKPHCETWLLNKDGHYQQAAGKRSIMQSPVMMLEYFVAELKSADLVYGHNIRRHDLPMIQAHLVREELPLLKGVLTIDTCTDMARLGGMSRSLENLASFYELPGEKLKMTQAMWEEANRLTPRGLDWVKGRVESDVILQEKLLVKQRELRHLDKRPRFWA